MKHRWTDQTSYSRGEPYPRTPRVWDLRTDAGLRITVFLGRKTENVDPPWCFHCFDIGIEDFPLSFAPTHERAKEMAIQLVRVKLQKLLDSLNP